MRQLASRHDSLKSWLSTADADTDRSPTDGPLGNWFGALLGSAGVPDYPLQITHCEVADAAGHRHLQVRLDSACPYEAAARLSLQLSRVLLNWADEARQQGHLHLPNRQLQTWLEAIANLPSLLPSREVMAFHHELWLAGINWQWLKGERTLVGQGVRQRLVTGVPALGFPGDADAWRIPIYTVTGSVGKTTTARLLSQLLADSGPGLALTASDGAWVGEQRLHSGDCIGGVSARAMLQRPDVSAAVFEQGRGGMLTQGVPYARSDVAVLLNVQVVHLGLGGIDTLEAMADVKALGLRPARLAVLNLDDSQCRRIGSLRQMKSCVWFSLLASTEKLRDLSRTSGGSLGVERNAACEPLAILIWHSGQFVKRLSLQGIAPYHGLLGDKTIEELLATVAAGWFGPLPVKDWASRFQALRLDSDNHLFRTSVHRQDQVVYVLDKAAEEASLKALVLAMDEIAKREGVVKRIVVMCRAAAEHPERHRESCRLLHRFMDEFICFDRPDTYVGKAALPIYTPGSIPLLLQDEVLRLNAQYETHKLVTLVPDWDAAEVFLRDRLKCLAGKTLVLINQPSTSLVELNQRIVDFVRQ